MLIRDIMSQYPTACERGTSIAEAARLMRRNDYGILPVLDPGGRPVGVITDRDIVCRAVAEGRDPATTTVDSCMSAPAITLSGDAMVGACLERMKQQQVRRIVAIDERGACIGIVSQADLAASTGTEEMGEVAASIVQPERPIAST